VNFGAADGECGFQDDWNADPANCLISKGDAGIVIEGNEKFWPILQQRFGHRENVSLVLQFVPLSEVKSLLRSQLSGFPPGASASPDLLKVDLDHADCLFLEKALEVIDPKLVHVEFNPLIPPPMDYAQSYQESLLTTTLFDRALPVAVRSTEQTEQASLGAELTGCSLLGFLSRSPGYELVVAGDEEAILVRRNLHASLSIGPPVDSFQAWAIGSHCHPLRGNPPGTTAWAFDFRVLADQSIRVEERLKLIDTLLRDQGPTNFSLRLVPVTGVPLPLHQLL